MTILRLKKNISAGISVPYGTTQVVMYNKFNSNIVFPETVTKISLGWSFNKPIILPINLESFAMGWCFNREISLPDTLLYLKIGRNFFQEIILPKKLIALDILCCSPLKYMSPNFLKLNCLPRSLRKLVANVGIYNYISNLPITLNVLYLCIYKIKNIIPPIEKRNIYSLTIINYIPNNKNWS